MYVTGGTIATPPICDADTGNIAQKADRINERFFHIVCSFMQRNTKLLKPLMQYYHMRKVGLSSKVWAEGERAGDKKTPDRLYWTDSASRGTFYEKTVLWKLQRRNRGKAKKKNQSFNWFFLARPARFELTTFWFVVKHSIRLSYGRSTGCIVSPLKINVNRKIEIFLIFLLFDFVL